MAEEEENPYWNGWAYVGRVIEAPERGMPEVFYDGRAVPPKHYALEPEPISAIEGWELGFNLGNVVKYIARAKHKGSERQDLEKALYYLKRELGEK